MLCILPPFKALPGSSHLILTTWFRSLYQEETEAHRSCPRGTAFHLGPEVWLGACPASKHCLWVDLCRGSEQYLSRSELRKRRERGVFTLNSPARTAGEAKQVETFLSSTIPCGDALVQGLLMAYSRSWASIHLLAVGVTAYPHPHSLLPPSHDHSTVWHDSVFQLVCMESLLDSGLLQGYWEGPSFQLSLPCLWGLSIKTG